MKCDANSFEINNGGMGDNSMAKQGSDCTGDYILIEGSNQGGAGSLFLHDKYCGGILNDLDDNLVDTKIKDCTAPFEVGVVTDAIPDATATADVNEASGICLTYTQEPCSSPNLGPIG